MTKQIPRPMTQNRNNSQPEMKQENEALPENGDTLDPLIHGYGRPMSTQQHRGPILHTNYI